MLASDDWRHAASLRRCSTDKQKSLLAGQICLWRLQAETIGNAQYHDGNAIARYLNQYENIEAARVLVQASGQGDQHFCVSSRYWMTLWRQV